MMNENDPQDMIERLAELVKGRYYGKYRGLVRNNIDPQRRGRLQVAVPAVTGTVPVWALPCVPFAGRRQGFFAMPDLNTPVWVEFEGGDPSYPIWVGCFFRDLDVPELDARPSVKFLKTKQASIRIDDNLGEIELSIGASKIIINHQGVFTDGTQVRGRAGARSTLVSAKSVSANNGALEVL